jgi:uncharacterized protein GlcG (DUF336 family)
MPKNSLMLTMEDTRALIEHTVKSARQAGIAVTVAVVDVGGNLIGLLRMDGTKLASIEVARGKAWTSAIFQRASGDYSAATAPGGGAYGMLNSYPGKFLPVLGGQPIVLNGECIGAVGISGGTGDQDDAIAKAAVATLTN